MRKWLDKRSSEAFVEFDHIVDANQFYMHLASWSRRRVDLAALLRTDYSPSERARIGYAPTRPGTLCAYVDESAADGQVVKRAKITDTGVVYLIDHGRHVRGVANASLYRLLDKYAQMAPLCFECTLNVDSVDSHTHEQLSAKFKCLAQMTQSQQQVSTRRRCFKMKLIDELDALDATTSTTSRYVIGLYILDGGGDESDPAKPQQQQISVGDELKALATSLQQQRVTSSTGSSSSNSSNSSKPFGELSLPIRARLRARLTNVETSKLFGLIASEQSQRRLAFLDSLHRWHRDHRSTLRHIADGVGADQALVGCLCVLNSIVAGKWSRGIVLAIAQCAPEPQAHVYMLDYCRFHTVAVSRLFRLESCSDENTNEANANDSNEQFVREPALASRCKLADDEPMQLELFEKYLTMLNSSAGAVDDYGRELTVDNIELQVECVDKSLITMAHNVRITQYTVSVCKFYFYMTCLFVKDTFNNWTKT